MARKVMAAMLACLLFCAFGTMQASAADPYEGSISTTYITIFGDIVPKLGIGDEYVMFRSDQYTYTLISGDLTLEGSRFELEGEGVRYDLTSTSSYNSYYEYSVYDIDSFSLSAGDHLVYSSLGDYPLLTEGSDNYALASLILFGSFLIALVLRPVFGFCLRTGRGKGA